MTYQEFAKTIEVKIDGKIELDGVEVSHDIIETSLIGRMWASAVVVKTKREAVNTSVKATIGQAVKLDIITRDDAFDLMMTPDKAKIAEIREQLPKVEKSEHPSDDDFEIAKKQFFANGGQRSKR